MHCYATAGLPRSDALVHEGASLVQVHGADGQELAGAVGDGRDDLGRRGRTQREAADPLPWELAQVSG